MLSAVVSCLAAIPVARALARRRFWGRSMFIALLGAPFILPVVVAVMGLLAIFGRSGWINGALEGIGAGTIEIYGLVGVVLAHVFLNLPLATRLLLQGWLAIPSERIRLAQSLNFTGADMRRHFERPLLAAALPGAMLVIFLICTTSFAVALILGGGPSATTVELAIYQAFRFDFDLGRAAYLGLIQVAICVAAGLLAWRFAQAAQFGGGLDRPAMRWPGDSGLSRGGDAAVLLGAGLFLLLPLLAVAGQGVGAITGLPPSTWEAAIRSVLLALASTASAVGLAHRIVDCGPRSAGRFGRCGPFVHRGVAACCGHRPVHPDLPGGGSGCVVLTDHGAGERAGGASVPAPCLDPGGGAGRGDAGPLGRCFGDAGDGPFPARDPAAFASAVGVRRRAGGGVLDGGSGRDRLVLGPGAGNPAA